MYEKIKFFVDYDNRETEECYVAFFKIGKILLSDLIPKNEIYTQCNGQE